MIAEEHRIMSLTGVVQIVMCSILRRQRRSPLTFLLQAPMNMALIL